MKFSIFLVFFLASCSVETMNVGEGAKADVDTEEGEGAGPRDEEPSSPEPKTSEPVTVTTTTTTETKVEIPGETVPADDGVLYLVNKNAAVDKFVSENYCRGSNLHDCYIRSGKMTPVKNQKGAYVVSLEFWDTEDADEPYKIVESTISVEGALLLTTKAKLPDDEGIDYKFLWAVVDPETKTLDVIYDWAGDGPQDQGDDLVQSFTFQPKGGG